MAVILKEPALKDIREIFQWYEEQRNGLGEEFLEELDLLLPYLSIYPKSFNKKYKNFRMINLSRFPYLVYYHIEKENVIIHRIVHAARNKRKLKW